MPKGIIWLVVGIVVGVIAGWTVFGNPVAGGAAGFVIMLTVLLVGSRLGGEGENEDVSISGR
jgi:hypothetical protein